MLTTQAPALVVLEKIFSNYKPMADIDAHGVWSIWTTQAWLAGFMKGTTIHCYMYIQNIEAVGLIVSEKIFFLFLPL